MDFMSKMKVEDLKPLRDVKVGGLTEDDISKMIVLAGKSRTLMEDSIRCARTNGDDNESD